MIFSLIYFYCFVFVVYSFAFILLFYFSVMFLSAKIVVIYCHINAEPV